MTERERLIEALQQKGYRPYDKQMDLFIRKNGGHLAIHADNEVVMWDTVDHYADLFSSVSMQAVEQAVRAWVREANEHLPSSPLNEDRVWEDIRRRMLADGPGAPADSGGGGDGHE